MNQKKGFGTMDPDKQRKIASLGGLSAWASGKAHKWTSEEAKAAGELGGKARRGSQTTAMEQ